MRLLKDKIFKNLRRKATEPNFARLFKEVSIAYERYH